MKSNLDWNAIDTVLLDMDGTLLDLHFDNRFWIEHLPMRWGEKLGLTYQQAFERLYPVFKAREGTLEWYSVSFWQKELGMDIVALKEELAHLVTVLPGVEEFLRVTRARGKRLVLVTNAHDHTLEFKLAKISIGQYFDAMYTSHQFGVPKEGDNFWELLQAKEPFDKHRALFADDSERVLQAAQRYGIANIIAMRRPDSTKAAKHIDGFDSVESLLELLPDDLRD